jgi:hypothetical protein
MARKEAREAERPIMSSGVGESRTFNAPEGAFPVDPNNPRDLSNCTLNGQPVPEHLLGLIPYEMTDQGYAEKHQGKEHARTSILVDEVHQSIRRRGGDLEADMGEFAFDPMLALVREHVPAGMRPKFLSKRKVDAEGTTRGYKICRKENGDPVALGTSILGYMPEARAAAIQQAFEDKSHEAQREMYGEDFDPRNPGRERVFEKFREQDKLTRGQHGPSRLSESQDPSDSEFGLSQSEGEEFQL